MTDGHEGRMRFAMFGTLTPAPSPPSHWHHPKAIDFDYLNLDHWISLARALEDAKFDCLFWADHTGVHDTFGDSYESALQLSLQFPIGDPILLAAALASSTSELGFAFSANVIQHHPYIFARMLTTLDHFSRGRIAWNVVTSFQKSAWANLGHDQVEPHAMRYGRAEEYIDVIYKLVEGSWEDGAVIRDAERRIFADPDKVHPIHHSSPLYQVPGIHSLEPSPQRLPVIFQAGGSDEGRDFAAKHAEAIFAATSGRNPVRSLRTLVDDMERRLKANGRTLSDVLFFPPRSYIVGSTEEEARRRYTETREMLLETDYCAAYTSSILGLDLSRIDLDKPIGDFKSDSVQGPLRSVIEGASGDITFRELTADMAGNAFVGTPEQAADEIEAYRDAGANGINFTQMTGVGEVYDFIEYVCPILRDRGLMQREYAPGTFREKLFAGTDSPSGPRVNERHPAAQFRHTTSTSDATPS